MPTISQNLAVPAGLISGGVISATHITPVYTALNAFNIPSTVGGFQQAFVETTTDTIAAGGSKDYTIAVTKDKALIIVMSFNWLVTAPQIQFRLNAGTITAATAVGTASSGAGIIFGLIAGHDATFQKPAVFFVMPDDGNGLKSIAANTTLPNVDYSSVGVFATVATATLSVAYKAIFNQG